MKLNVLADSHLDAVTTQLGNTIVHAEMNDECVFFLCNDNKLKIFEIESGDLVKEIETGANQIKLTSVDCFVLFDSTSRMVYLYEQTGEFCKIHEINLAKSLEADLKINRDKFRTLAFYNSTYMKYTCLD
jgi:hypothetical protein